MKLFKREPSADDALVSVANQRGWSPVAASAFMMIPPSHAAADVHDLGSRRPPGCGGRAFEAKLAAGPTALVSHCEIYRSDVDHEIYDVVQWPCGPAARLELLVDSGGWNHHRLTDRFGRSGWRAINRPDGMKLHVGRAEDSAFVEPFAANPRLDALMPIAAGLRGGFAAEIVDDRAAVFTWTAMARRGTDRWDALVNAAEVLAQVITEAGAARPGMDRDAGGAGRAPAS